MKNQVSTPIVVAAIILVVLVVGWLGYRYMAPDKGLPNLTPPPPPKETEGMAPHPKPSTMGGFKH